MATTLPTVSVVIPTYNRECFVRNAIDSVLNQTFTDYELIVVDDGSTDNTADVVGNYGRKVRYIYQQNAGPSAARNSGISAARGRWIAFLDSDDEWTRHYLSIQMAHAEMRPGLCMQSTNSRYTGLEGETRSYFEINGCLPNIGKADFCLINEPFSFVVEHGPWQLGAVMMLREAIIRAGAFDERLRFSEDFDLMARVSLHGSFGLIREELVKIYRRHEKIESLTKKAAQNPLQVMQWNGEIYEQLKELPLLTATEQKTLKRLVAANRRAIGNFLWSSGKRCDARESYKSAVRVDPSVASIGRCVLSYLRIS
jgi:glycosyltransferase involved in cell wall biosynthesis